ncbi:hypothetical protein OQA88_6527 [Cercophora sp. LCS_1]
MFRPMTRQLARCYASASLRAAARPTYRTAAFARIPQSTANSLRRPFSTQRPSSDGGEQQPDRKESGESPYPDSPNLKLLPLPPGWVRLTPEEINQFTDLLKRLPRGDAEMNAESIQNLKIYGAPVGFRELLEKQRTSGLTMFDSLKAIKSMKQFHDRVMQDEDAWESRSPTQFDSNKPGQEEGRKEEPRDQKTSEQGQEKPREGEQQQQQQRQQEGQGPHRRQRKPDPNEKPVRLDWTDIAAGVGSTFVLYLLWDVLFGKESNREITWQELRSKFLDKGLVQKMTVSGDRVTVELNQSATQSVYPDSIAARPGFNYYFTIGSVDAFEKRLDAAQEELGIPSSERIPVTYANEGSALNLLLAFGPTLLLISLIGLMTRRAGGMGGGGSNGMFGFGKSRAKMFNHDSAVKVKFADVAGMDEAKVEIMEFVSFLKNPERFQKLGAKIPRGAILSGPPGTGKTLLAKATAGESQVPFFSVSGSEFVEMFVGVGASRVRDLFATARKNAPCIIFIDEIDAVGKSRADGKGFKGGGNDEREATLNQILTEMDGFNTSEQVVVLAGTNRADILDQALMRPGRFDRHIHIDRPTMKGRQAIFKVHLAKIVTKEDTEYLTGRLAALTPGFAGADIANAVNEAALVAARANADSVEMIHFEQAIERVVGGLERRSLVLSPEEKRTVAYHEAGHAICGWFFRWADPLLKVSIIPRGQGALGYAQYLPAGDAYLMNTNQLMDRMAMTLGGRISEELHFSTVTSGASDDFRKVTQMATTMVTQWGMSEKLGPLHFNNDPNYFQKPFAESTAQTIDTEVRRIVDQAYKQCKDLLTAKKKEIGVVAEELLRKEVLTRDDMVRLLGPRQWPDKEEFTKYFDGRKTGDAPPPFPTENTDSPPEEPQPAIFEKTDGPDVPKP